MQKKSKKYKYYDLYTSNNNLLNPDVINQGKLGTCYLLSVLSSIFSSTRGADNETEKISNEKR